MSNAPVVLPVQYSQIGKSDLEAEGLPALNNQLAQLFTRFNQVLGAQGPTPLHAGVDLRGARVSNLGTPVDQADAISQGQATTQFSSPVQRSNLDIGGKYALKGLTSVTFQANQLQQQLNGIVTPYVGGSNSTTLPSGIIIKWGTTTAFNATTLAVTFPTPFPTALFVVIPVTFAATDTITYLANSPAPSATGFTVGNNGLGAVTWIAIGM